MITLRIGKEIFTAEYIVKIGKVITYLPSPERKTFMDMTMELSGSKSEPREPYAHFSIFLITGEEIKKFFSFRSLSEETKQLAASKVKEIQESCGFEELVKIRKAKLKAVEKKLYEECARLRSQEVEVWEKIEETGYINKISEEVMRDIILKGLVDMAEARRTDIEKVVNEAKSPTLI